MWAEVVLCRGLLPGRWLSVCPVGLAYGQVGFVGDCCPYCGLFGAALVAVQGMCCWFGYWTRRYLTVAVEVRLDVALGRR